MDDLLDMPVEPLGWDDKNAGSSNAKNRFAKEQRWQGDRARASHPC